MKQAAILLFIGLLCFCNLKAHAQTSITKRNTLKHQNIITDSLGYMTEIVAHKEKYINQPLSVLLNDLKIPVKSYSLTTSSNKRDNVWKMDLSFNDSYVTSLKEMQGYKYPVGIHIEWNPSFSLQDAASHLSGRIRGEWTGAEQNYFGKEIVSDVISWSINE